MRAVITELNYGIWNSPGNAIEVGFPTNTISSLVMYWFDGITVCVRKEWSTLIMEPEYSLLSALSDGCCVWGWISTRITSNYRISRSL